MSLFMLDTNIAGHLMKERSRVRERVRAATMASLCVSAVTAGELHYGLAHNPSATRLKRGVMEFMLRVDVLPWDQNVAERYGRTRAELQRGGKTLMPLDLMIASHALSVGAILVTNDKAFQHVPDLIVEDWSI